MLFLKSANTLMNMICAAFFEIIIILCVIVLVMYVNDVVDDFTSLFFVLIILKLVTSQGTNLQLFGAVLKE